MIIRVLISSCHHICGNVHRFHKAGTSLGLTCGRAFSFVVPLLLHHSRHVVKAHLPCVTSLSPDPGIWMTLDIKATAWNGKWHFRETTPLFHTTQRCNYQIKLVPAEEPAAASLSCCDTSKRAVRGFYWLLPFCRLSALSLDYKSYGNESNIWKCPVIGACGRVGTNKERFQSAVQASSSPRFSCLTDLVPAPQDSSSCSHTSTWSLQVVIHSGSGSGCWKQGRKSRIMTAAVEVPLERRSWSVHDWMLEPVLRSWEWRGR